MGSYLFWSTILFPYTILFIMLLLDQDRYMLGVDSFDHVKLLSFQVTIFIADTEFYVVLDPDWWLKLCILLIY